MVRAGVFMAHEASQGAVNRLWGSVGVEHDLMRPSAVGIVERVLLPSSVENDEIVELIQSGGHFQANGLASSIFHFLPLAD